MLKFILASVTLLISLKSELSQSFQSINSHLVFDTEFRFCLIDGP
jgi:hypothetical protein